MIRAIGKTLYACAYTWAGMSRWRPGPDATRTPFIVGYHRVVEDFAHSVRHTIPPMLTSASMFEQHLDWLGRRFEFVSLDEIGFRLENGLRFRKPAAAITFDDGYRDVYRNACPILRRKGIPAGIFLVSDMVGACRLPLYDKLYLLLARLTHRQNLLKASIADAVRSSELDCPELLNLNGAASQPFRLMRMILSRFPQSAIAGLINVLEPEVHLDRTVLEELAPLTWEMAADMHRNGFAIGSHTVSHPLLTQESAATVDYEVVCSKQTIEARLGTAVKHFAYPDGRFNGNVVEAVHAAGYRYGYGICPTRDPQYPLLTIPRKVLWERAAIDPTGRFSPEMMNCHAHWAFDRLRDCEHDHGSNGVEQSCQGRLNIA